ncbi:GGDEF domain-containing protein [Alkalibacterium iburiense]
MGYFLMNFSIVLDQGTRIDFRYIPIILIFLFINDKAAIVSAVLIAAARFIIGVSLTSYLSVFVLTVLVIGLYVIKHATRKHESMYLKGSIMVIYATTLYTIFFIQVTSITVELVTLLIFFWIVAMAGGLFALFIMNYLRTAELLLRKYEAESTIDYLTGLSNVRKFYQMLDYYTKKYKTKKTPLAIGMIDIDFFKRVNDKHGHDAGDIVLMEVARILEETIDDETFVFRKGGEEFTAIFPNAPLEDVLYSLERCRLAVQHHGFKIDELKELNLTISIGICHYSETASSVDELMTNADEKLYKAKETGRNRLVF